jgi:hypothetical protein
LTPSCRQGETAHRFAEGNVTVELTVVQRRRNDRNGRGRAHGVDAKLLDEVVPVPGVPVDVAVTPVLSRTIWLVALVTLALGVKVAVQVMLSLVSGCPGYRC